MHSTEYDKSSGYKVIKYAEALVVRRPRSGLIESLPSVRAGSEKHQSKLKTSIARDGVPGS
jgi:hypothetical protein